MPDIPAHTGQAGPLSPQSQEGPSHVPPPLPEGWYATATPYIVYENC